MLPIFSEEESDLEMLAADPEQERMFRLYTDFLWKFSNDVAPFSCDGKCQAPSGYFFGEPWMTVSSAEMGEDGKSVAVREGEGVEMSCKIWIGSNKATGVTASNVTITMNGAEIYKKFTNPFDKKKKENYSQPFRPKKVHVKEVRSPRGHSSEFKISIDSFGPEMLGNITCGNSIGDTNNVVDLILRVDCSYGDWSNWSTCSKSCLASDGIQGLKRRQRTSSPPQNGGVPCTEPIQDVAVCASDRSKLILCPQNHNLSEWTTWSACSAKCGPGKQVRSRSCTQGKHGGTQCPTRMENLIEKGSRECNVKVCPACILGSWLSWSPCTKSCLEESGIPGARRRKRNNREIDPSTPKCIVEHSEEEEPCAGEESINNRFTQCPIDAKMSAWSTWGPDEYVCGRLCKKGANATTTPIMQSRSRYCTEGAHGGLLCENLQDNDEEEVRMCPSSKPCPEDCTLSNWTTWSGCSKGCGPGKQYRERRLLGPFYGGQDCPEDIPITDNDDRCQAKGQNYKGREVFSAKYASSWSQCLKECVAEETCKHWVWYSSEECELISSSHSKTYSDSNVAAYGPKTCLDLVNRELKDCYLQTCPACIYESWSSWSDCGYCTKSSGSYRQRKRKISVPDVEDLVGVTLQCDGYDVESEGCGGSAWYWVVGIATLGIANSIAC